jgi:tRNA modification GTPase
MPHPRDRSGYLSEDTIAAIATEVGGAISMVRVSGGTAFSTLARLTQAEKSKDSTPRKLCRAKLFSETGEHLDDALFVRFVQPHSYTGEDLVEYQIHGGGFIAQRLMMALGQLGVRQALPGEFSFRAVRNGKMSLFQAQAVVDLIGASNDTAVSLALEKMSGTQNRFLDDLASGIRRVAVLGEAGIDFADQDLDEVSLPRLREQLAPLIALLENLKSSYARGLRVQDGIRVAFVGLPNAGKSSFFNALLGEDRSIVSEFAGTTRDVVREKLTLRGKEKSVTLRLEDTAGLRSTEDFVENLGIERTRNATQNADLVLFAYDPTSSFPLVQEEWRKLEAGSALLAAKTIGIITKSDEIRAEELQQSLENGKRLGIAQWAITSAISGEGITQAAQQIVEFCEHWTRRNPGEIILTRIDHLASVQEALEHLVRAQSVTEIDLFASDIRQALNALGPLIGETLPDDILGKIFSDFCIGK